MTNNDLKRCIQMVPIGKDWRDYFEYCLHHMLVVYMWRTYFNNDAPSIEEIDITTDYIWETNVEQPFMELLYSIHWSIAYTIDCRDDLMYDPPP